MATTPLPRPRKKTLNAPPALHRMDRWKLEDAKARLSEVVRRAGQKGPQLVTVRGQEAAVILTPEQYQRLLPHQEPPAPLTEFLRELDLSALHVERELDRGRDLAL